MLNKIFFVPLLQIECDDWINKKKILLDLLIDNESFIKKDGNLYTDFHNQKRKQIDVKNIFENELEQFKNSFNFQKLHIGNSWFEKAKKNQHHTIHNHSNYHYSAVCYISYCEQEHEPIIFVSPFNNLVYNTTMFYKPTDVKEGTIIFFPSVINHNTTPNNSEQDRLVVSFNMFVE